MEGEQETSKMAELFPHSIELTKGQKGGYGWVIKIRFPADRVVDAERMAKAVKDVDAELRKTFGEQGSSGA